MNTTFRDYIAGLDTLVPTQQGQRPYINLDNAATTPPLKSVLAAVNDFAPWYSSVHRGNGLKSRLSTEVYEAARRTVGKFVDADSGEFVVIFGKNTTEAINKLSNRLNLRRTDVVLVSHLEHHSNDLPWRAHATVKRVALDADGSVSHEDFVRLLERHASRVRLVAISGASNVTGHLPDVHWFARKAHEAGAQIFVDCAQLAAHRPIRMKHLDDPEHLDYIALSAHKMYAPFGTGALVARRDAFLRGNPDYSGGGTILSVTTKVVDWALPPDSDEAGSPNVVGAVALARAIKTLEAIGLPRIAAHEADLTTYALQTFRKIPGMRLYGDHNPAYAAKRSGVVPFTLANVPAHLVAAVLGYEWGIGVRSGCFCAQPYVMHLLNVDQDRIRRNILHHRRDIVPGLVRVSFGMYNTRGEVDRLAEALQAIARGQHGQYIVNPALGTYSPLEQHEQFSAYFDL